MSTHLPPLARAFLVLFVGLSASTAGAADEDDGATDELGAVSVGVGAVLGVDLPEALPFETRFGAGAGLLVPIRVRLSPAAALRVSVRADHHGGTDAITWKAGDDRTWQETRAWLFALGATVGPEVQVPLDGPVRPYLAGGIGAALVGTYHSFDRCELMDPKQNDCDDPGNIDPYTTQPALVTEVAGGARFGGPTFFWSELGYSVAYLGARDLTKAASSKAVRRETYAWNAVRLSGGVSFTF